MVDSLECLNGCLPCSPTSLDLLEFEVEQKEKSHIKHSHEHGSIVRIFLRTAPKEAILTFVLTALAFAVPSKPLRLLRPR